MLFALLLIAQKLNSEGIMWALGGSNVLKQFDLIETVNDIDILVSEKDIVKANQILASIGSKMEVKANPNYLTTYFYSYRIKKFKVDLMCDFKIKYNDIVYTYTFDETSITSSDEIAKEKIFFTSLEDWYVLYRLMDREDDEKIKNLEKHFELHGIKHPQILKRTLENVPRDLKLKIKYQLNLN